MLFELYKNVELDEFGEVIQTIPLTNTVIQVEEGKLMLDISSPFEVATFFVGALRE
jgi:hypothetical protein